MAKKAKGLYAKVAHIPVFHKTSIGRNPSLQKMNKNRRRSFQTSLNILYWIYERKTRQLYLDKADDC